jgi:hypothetical protein
VVAIEDKKNDDEDGNIFKQKATQGSICEMDHFTDSSYVSVAGNNSSI